MDTTTLILLKLFNERHSLSVADLSAILNGDPVTLSEPIKYMLEKKLIEVELNSSMIEDDAITMDKKFAITYSGRITLEEELKLLKKNKHNEFRAWITLIIALSAFIKSFFY